MTWDQMMSIAVFAALITALIFAGLRIAAVKRKLHWAEVSVKHWHGNYEIAASKLAKLERVMRPVIEMKVDDQVSPALKAVQRQIATLVQRTYQVEKPGDWTEWVHPEPGYRMECCGCGLEHELAFEIVADQVPGRARSPGEEGQIIIMQVREIVKRPAGPPPGEVERVNEVGEMADLAWSCKTGHVAPDGTIWIDVDQRASAGVVVIPTFEREKAENFGWRFVREVEGAPGLVYMERQHGDRA